jgi:hypothetical protein
MAGQPYHERSVETGTEIRAAGTECDFDYRLDYTTKWDFKVYGEPGAETRMLLHMVDVITHTNLGTGYALTENVVITEMFDTQTGVDKIVGIAWHLRDADGRLVTVHAGQLIID